MSLNPKSIVCALLLAACSTSDPNDASAPRGRSSYDASTSGVRCDATDTIDLNGTWAMVMRLSLVLRSQVGGVVTMCPDQQPGDAFLVFVVHVEQDPSDPRIIRTYQPQMCSLELPSLFAVVGQCDPESTNKLTVSLPFPPALNAALPAVPVGQVQGTMSDATGTPAFSVDRFMFVMGTRLGGEMLPTWKFDMPGCGSSVTDVGRAPLCEGQCVVGCEELADDDADGWAAVTVHVCGYSPDSTDVPCNAEKPSEAGAIIQGRLLLDFQVDPALSGTVRSSCETTGIVDATVIYHLVGADVFVANTAVSVTAAAKSLPLFTVDGTRSPFRMVRVDGRFGSPNWLSDAQASPCQSVLTHKNDLF